MSRPIPGHRLTNRKTPGAVTGVCECGETSGGPVTPSRRETWYAGHIGPLRKMADGATPAHATAAAARIRAERARRGVPPEGVTLARTRPGQTQVTIAAPGPWLAANDRAVWQVRWQRTKAWRDAAHIHARRQRATPVVGPYRVVATIHKATHVHYDLDGVTLTVKACIDGLRDAGVLDGDDHTEMTELTTRPGDIRKPACVVLTITPATTEETR